MRGEYALVSVYVYVCVCMCACVCMCVRASIESMSLTSMHNMFWI